MQTTYHLNANELTPDFVESVKSLFGKKPIEIIVMDAPQESNESTEYLFGNEANRIHLLRLMDKVERGENLVSVPLETLKNLLSALNAETDEDTTELWAAESERRWAQYQEH